MTDRIDIAFGFDGNYAPHAAAALASLCAYDPPSTFRIMILYSGVTDEQKRKFESVAPGAEFVWLEVRDEDMPPFHGKTYISKSTLFRLGLEKQAPADCRRVLYLDADLILLRSARPLWNTDLDGRPIGAVVDAFLSPDAFAETWSLEPGGQYFNAGVLLIDLERVRAEQLFTKAAKFITEYGDRLPYHDQDALNWAFWKNWRALDVPWNVQRHMAQANIEHEIPPERRLAGRAPAIVHFMDVQKPWLPGVWHPWSWIYWRSLFKTPFVREVRQKYGVGRLETFRLWLRWLRRRPRPTAA